MVAMQDWILISNGCHKACGASAWRATCHTPDCFASCSETNCSKKLRRCNWITNRSLRPARYDQAQFDRANCSLLCSLKPLYSANTASTTGITSDDGLVGVSVLDDAVIRWSTGRQYACS